MRNGIDILTNLVLILVIFYATGCRNSNPNFSPFIGEWKTETGIIEVWKLNETNELIGQSYSIEDTDTILLETLSIREIDGNWYYAPRVMTQNHGREVLFKLMDCTDLIFTFENPKHDYPQRITYSFNAKTDSLTVHIETLSISNPQRNSFRFSKTKQDHSPKPNK